MSIHKDLYTAIRQDVGSPLAEFKRESIIYNFVQKSYIPDLTEDFINVQSDDG